LRFAAFYLIESQLSGQLLRFAEIYLGGSQLP